MLLHLVLDWLNHDLAITAPAETIAKNQIALASRILLFSASSRN